MSIDLRFLNTFSTRYSVLQQAIQEALIPFLDDVVFKERVIRKLKLEYGKFFSMPKPVGDAVTKESLKIYSLEKAEFLQVFVGREIPFIEYFCENGRDFDKLRDKMEETILGPAKTPSLEVQEASPPESPVTTEAIEIENVSASAPEEPLAEQAETSPSRAQSEWQKEGRKLMMSVLTFCFAIRMGITEFSSIDYHLVNEIQKIEPDLTRAQIAEFIAYARKTFPKHFKDDIPF
jgi:hypothetical protein